MSVMVKRIASAAIWFLAVGWALNYVTLMMGVPSIVGLGIAAAVSAFVGLDPLHLVWADGATSPKTAAANAARAPRTVHSPG